MGRLKEVKRIILWFVLLLPFFAGKASALDTDIYQSNVKQNCYILLDASGSMGFGVYESNIDYGAMFDELFTRNDGCAVCYDDYIYDTVNNSDYFYQNHNDKDRIYLIPGEMGIVSRTAEDGSIILFAGDAANPEYLWYSGDLIDTYTNIDAEGNLVPANPDAVLGDPDYQRLTVDDEGNVLFDGKRLPHSQDIELTHKQFLYGGGVIEDGFGDLLNAPGYYFSGYTHDYTTGTYSVADGGESIAYFFITGNWINMQQMYNLHYTTNNPEPQGASTGDPAWKFETYTFTSDIDWPLIDYSLDYPEGSANYQPGIEVENSITHPGAEKIKIHFDITQFDINPDGSPDNKKDWVIVQAGDGSEVAKYNNDNIDEFLTIDGETGWTPAIDGNTARIILDSYTDSSTVGTGYVVDKYRYYDGEYKMKNRLEIATSSMLNTIEHFRGQINWGTFTFPKSNGDGATSHQVINPNLNDDENRENIAADFKNVTPEGGTPIGEALQDVFEVGYYQHRNSIDNLICRKNYSIVLSDGFPSEDNDWERIAGITFEDFDGDGFTSDPYQPPTSPNYYDDVAHWMYTHSWHDKSEVGDPANSYENVSSHQISFGFQNPLMQDAAEEAGGLYITAYNEGQLNAAFYAIGLAIADAVSFTAPVVSVDAANKIQNGDDLYMGQFIPMDAGYWPGNLKKFKLGDGSENRPDKWEIYDAGTNDTSTEADENLATNPDGTFKDPEELTGFWRAVDPDYVGLPIHHDGVGEVLTKSVNDAFGSAPYYNHREIYYLNSSGNLVDFAENVTSEELGGVSEEVKDKIINFVYGYTFDANADGTPVSPRDWALGAIVHSRPTVIDYYDSDGHDAVSKRLIAVGASDGMLHFFEDTLSSDSNGTGPDGGNEVFAFIPSEVLPQLQHLATENYLPMVDGPLKLYRDQNGNPKYLFCGLRRGGHSYVRINVSTEPPDDWTSDTWSIAEFSKDEIPELAQSWSDIEFAKIKVADAGDGEIGYKAVAIFSGGYDPEEDNFPEPFNDLDNNGTPYADNGQIDGAEWDKNNPSQDVYPDNEYTIMNPEGNGMGRGIYVMDVEDLDLEFSAEYGETDSYTPASGDEPAKITRTDMKYCFPATPSVVTLAEIDGEERVNNVLQAIYASDIYGNMFRLTYNYNEGSPTWDVNKLFSSNPASSSGSSEIRQGDDTSDTGRKVFYGPTVSWGGSGRFFDKSNYYFDNYTFTGTGKIASLFFGTGDREHPTYQLVKNRVYAVYDDIPVNASGVGSITRAPYSEDDLLNITCDELGVNTTQAGKTNDETWSFKTSLQGLLTDDVKNITTPETLEYPGGADEDDAKGWYIVLEEQGASDYCSHCEYEAAVEDYETGRDYHVGEKILSKLTLFAGNLYFTSYQPAYDDPCVPEGNAFNYALNYLNGAAALNLNTLNDLDGSDDPVKKDVTDRYGKHSAVKGIPSGFEVVIRDGEAGAMASLGGGIIGGGEDGDFEIPYEDAGISLYYWIER
jgi:type IV pilus assembly protein PilY1